MSLGAWGTKAVCEVSCSPAGFTTESLSWVTGMTQDCHVSWQSGTVPAMPHGTDVTSQGWLQ